MKKTSIIGLLMGIMFIQFTLNVSAIDDTLCTSNPSKEAVALYRYLLDMKGHKILSGQMWAPWGIDELVYLQNITGKKPAIRGIDFITQSSNAMEVQNAINWWKAGGIPTIMWHWGAPGIGEGYENSKVAIDIDQCFIEGTPEYIAFWNELRIKADLLQQIRDAHVPVLWRPYHELNGNWFWWGKQGPERFKKLWRTMYDYFVHERGLNNLIWVLCYTGTPDALWYPGDDYVDIAGADTYDAGDGPQTTMFNSVKTITANKFPIAYHECGIPPNPDQCLKQNAMWSWWMEWHTTYLQAVDTAYLKWVYNHDLVITRDEIPDIMATYGWDSTCKASVITHYVRPDENAWQQTARIQEGTASVATLYPQVSDSGTFSWNGYGTSGSDTVQVIVVGESGSAQAVFTNTCGAVTTANFIIAEACSPTFITPYLRVNGGSAQNTTSATINYGASVTLGPYPLNGGSWSWSGDTTATTREITFIPAHSGKFKATYTNTCGTNTFKTFTITVNCATTTIIPYMQAGNGLMYLTARIAVNEGDSVTISPLPSAGGTWKWSGGYTGLGREITFMPVDSCVLTLLYTNPCGKTSRKTFTVDVIPATPNHTTYLAESTVYPNPFDQYIVVDMPGATAEAEIRLYSADGVMRLNQMITEKHSLIDLSSIKPGLYILHIISDRSVITQKLVKRD